ncbi:unnamed protein product [Pseudo-nitzschia multistriata]|uniref:peptidylprolyl isomerase n=1 Tax=Pseudo-nitzschia multistriata TaxID=183589 RepID=A0A448Z948_9STRA|nr:unnamed protein product [Pseudo-nitzschia multistriata]
MGRRRKRLQSEDYDDSLERSFSAKRSKPENDDSGKGGASKQDVGASPAKSGETQNHNDSNSKKNDKDSIERLREKKRLKKQRQKEKKLAAQKEQEKLKILQEKQNKEREKRKQKQKKLKELEKKVSSDTNTFIKTSMGVRYMDVVVGTGPLLVDRKKIVCQYVLRAKNKYGKVLDSGERFAFKFGKGEVIPGWEIGLKGMKQGGKRHIIVPPNAGYGFKDIGGGKGAMLYFEVTLVKC